MYIYVREEGTKRFRVFGPATASECQAWMRRMRINPKISCPDTAGAINELPLQLPEAHDEDETHRIE